VPGFWPKAEQTHRIPFDRDEIQAELERLKAKRIYLREKRLREQGAQQGSNEETS
jgi:protein PET100